MNVDGGDTIDSSTADSGGTTHPGGDAGTPVDAGGGADATTDGDGALPAGTALVRVHYPALSHTVTIRGGAAGLTWTSGTAMAASGDTYTVSLTGITMPVEWKPFLDDATWVLGPNYHVASG